MIIITMIANWLMSRRSSMTQSRATFLAKAILTAVVAIVATVAFLVWLDGQKDAAVEADRTAQDIGAIKQREADLRETIERVETGNATREEVKREVDAGSGDVLYAQCLRTARTPANCQRFLRGGEAVVR